MTRHLERWVLIAAGLSAIASMIHGAVTGEHFEEWWGYGLFFVVAAAAQMSFAVLLVLGPWRPGSRRPDEGRGGLRTIALLGILGNALIIGLWGVTRTIGVPLFGPEAGEVEEVGTIDLISKVAELALIAVLAWIYRLAGPETSSGAATPRT
jgi:hypothetical protein